MDMQTSRTLLGTRPELIDHFSTIDEATITVADILITIEDMDGQSSLVMSLARAAREYLQRVEKANFAIINACKNPMSAAIASHDGKAIAPDVVAPVMPLEALQFIETAYQSPDRPSFSSCYRLMVKEFAAPRGLEVPSKRQVKRLLRDRHAARMGALRQTASR